MVSLDDKKRAARARSTIVAIAGSLDESPVVLKRVGPHLGCLVLNELPSEVRAFQYSEDHSEIRAERDTGEETWDAERTILWTSEVEAGREVSLRRQVGLS